MLQATRYLNPALHSTDAFRQATELMGTEIWSCC